MTESVLEFRSDEEMTCGDSAVAGRTAGPLNETEVNLGMLRMVAGIIVLGIGGFGFVVGLIVGLLLGGF